MRAMAEIPRTNSTPGHWSLWNGLFAIDGGTIMAREVVVMTKEAVEFAGTVTAPQAVPWGNPEQVRTDGTLALFVIIYIAEDPAETVCERGEAVRAFRFPSLAVRTVLPPA